MILAGHDCHEFGTHISYTLDTLLSALGPRFRSGCLCPICRQEPERPDLFYGRDPWAMPGDAPRLWVIRSTFFGAHYLEEPSLPLEPLDRIDFRGLSAPVLYGAESPHPEGWTIVSESDSAAHWIAERDGRYATNIDVVASSFYELTRYEEVVKGQTGSVSGGSLCAREGYLTDPVVNAYSKIVGKMLSVQRDGPPVPIWPGGRRFAVCLTHDIDLVSARASINWYRHDISTYGLARPLSSLPLRAIRLAWSLLRHRSPFWTFDEIMAMESRAGFRSTFFFIQANPEPTGPDYGVVGSRRIERLIGRLKKGGWEVGLHSLGDSRLGVEMEGLSSIGMRPGSVRMHRLSMEVPRTWRRFAESGLKLDCSLGYNDRSGFRGGFCHPFLLFDAEKGRELGVLELPLAVMDASYYWYQRANPAQAWSGILKALEAVERHSGVLVVLWHNNFFDRVLLNGWREVYLRLLQEIETRGAYVAPAEAVARHWLTRMKRLRSEPDDVGVCAPDQPDPGGG